MQLGSLQIDLSHDGQHGKLMVRGPIHGLEQLVTPADLDAVSAFLIRESARWRAALVQTHIS